MTHIIFLINLLQDVNVVRPLLYLAAADFDAELSFLVSDTFVKRDAHGVWMAELGKLGQQLGADLHIHDSPLAAYGYLQGKKGLLIAASESNLNAHRQTHQIFRIAPPSFLKVTLQHGFECVGFLQNSEQSAAHGTKVVFAADVVCGWSEANRLTAMVPSERSKLYVSGPPALLQRKMRRDLAVPAARRGGMVCENLHSVRFTIDAHRQSSFMGEFGAFCASLAGEQKSVTLRPHPGGQYVLRNNVALPPNVSLENRPMYDVDLASFDFGISAPSTVLLDMVLAGIPVAVWRDPAAGLDTSNYAGLRMIGGGGEWLRFERDATEEPAGIVADQDTFLGRLDMPLDPGEVRTRFARLFAGAGVPIAVQAMKPRRILFIVNAMIPSFAISFLRPIAAPHAAGEFEYACLTEVDLRNGFAAAGAPATGDWIEEQICDYRPDLVVMCRYSGPHSQRIIAGARRVGARTIYHLDDDLLNIPIEIGEKKYLAHNAADRLGSVRTFLDNVDLVYASTPALMRRIVDLGFTTPIVAGSIYCSNEVRREPVRRLSGTIGYMGFDHAHDLETMLPALVTVLQRHPALKFELFGSIPKPAVLDQFGDRISIVGPIADYAQFMRHFASMDWDIGICPLADTPFNRVKADTKWVEYSAVGIAVVATGGMMYDECCSEGCGLLATDDESWIAAIETLMADRDDRYEMVKRAQDKLRDRYSLDALRRQMIAVFDWAERKISGAAPTDAMRQLLLFGEEMTPREAVVRAVGVEPTLLAEPDFESGASTNFTTPAVH